MPIYNYYRSWTYPDVCETENLADVFNPFKNEFISESATVNSFVKFMELFLKKDTITFEKMEAIWPQHDLFWSSFVARLKSDNPELLKYLFLADAYNRTDDEICVYVPDSGSPYMDTKYVNNYTDAVTWLTHAKSQLNHYATLSALNLPITTLLGKLKVYTANYLGAFEVAGSMMSPLYLRRSFTEDRFPAGFELDDELQAYFRPKIAEGAAQSRDHLQRVFPHSTDVTRLLGTRTVAKKKVKRGDKDVTFDREASPILYGVELECSTNKTAAHIIDAQVSEVFLVCKQDGSITGSKRNAVELVTKPQDLRTHRRGWAKFMGGFYDKETNTYPDFDVTRNTDNGMHVHISRDAFSDEYHIKRLNYFLAHPLNNEFILAVSERDKASLNKWTRLPVYSANVTDKYVYEIASRSFMGLGKYSAVNHNKTHTLEIRIFKGIFSYATVMKNLEFCDALMHFTQEFGIAQLTLEGFMSWLNGLTSRRYKALRMFLSKIDVDTMIETNKTNKRFAKATTPEQALAIVDKWSIPQTKALASLLNIRFGGKKSFHWDNKTQKLLLCHKDKATLFQFDEEFHTLYGKTKPTKSTAISPSA